MKEEIKNAIEKYQCSGCMVGGDIACFKENPYGIGCASIAGTIIYGIGKIFLGMPNGFNRLGLQDKMIPEIHEKYNKNYDMWNVPTWKHLNADGHTYVRGLMPRRNEAFLHIFLENCMDKINCQEITIEDIDYMD